MRYSRGFALFCIIMMVLELPESGKQSTMKAVEIQLKISEDFCKFYCVLGWRLEINVYFLPKKQKPVAHSIWADSILDFSWFIVVLRGFEGNPCAVVFHRLHGVQSQNICYESNHLLNLQIFIVPLLARGKLSPTETFLPCTKRLEHKGAHPKDESCTADLQHSKLLRVWHIPNSFWESMFYWVGFQRAQMSHEKKKASKHYGKASSFTRNVNCLHLPFQISWLTYLFNNQAPNFSLCL